MAEIPTLCVHPDPTSTLYRPASPAEILAAARPFLDYEAAVARSEQRLSIAFPGPWQRDGLPRLVREVVDAALGLTEERLEEKNEQ